jgi:hypothetical protein
MIKARARARDECAQVNFLRDFRLIALFPNADTKMDTPSYMTGWEDAIVNHIFYFCMPRSFLLASKHTHTRRGVCTKGKQRRCVFYGRCFSSMQISRRLF